MKLMRDTHKIMMAFEDCFGVLGTGGTVGIAWVFDFGFAGKIGFKTDKNQTQPGSGNEGSRWFTPSRDVTTVKTESAALIKINPFHTTLSFKDIFKSFVPELAVVSPRTAFEGFGQVSAGARFG
jgi:hypothetical protein